MFVRLALGVSYLKLSHDKLYRSVVYFAIFYATALGIIGILFRTLRCIPTSQIWKPNDHCVGQAPNSWVMPETIVTVILDLILFFLPLKLVWKLNSSMAQRIQVIFVFGLGSLWVSSLTPHERLY